MAVSVSPKAGVGGTLRRARRDRGLSLEEVALRTRIHPRHLRALEHDAPPQTFKAPIYARAFLREYAACVGLDPEPLVDAYRTAHHDPPQPLRLLPSPPKPDRKVLKRIGWVAAILVLIAGSVALAIRWQNELPRPAQPLTAPPAADPEATGGGGGVTYTDGVHLEVRVRDADSLVRVVRNGEVLVDAEREVGWSRTFHAPRRLEVWTRNAGAVVFILNGDRVGTLGDYGERARGRFVWNGERARLVNG